MGLVLFRGDVSSFEVSSEVLTVPGGPGPGDGSDLIPSDDAFSLMFLISLSITFGLLLFILVLISVYLTFCGGENDTDSDDEEEEGSSAALKFFKKRSSLLLDGSFMTPGKFDDDEAFKERAVKELAKMSSFEVELYKRTQEFQRMSPPMVKPFGSFLNSYDKQVIKDRGIQSYFFLPSINDNVDADGTFLPSFFVEDKLNVSFTQHNISSSAIMNYPLPSNKKDAVYFEVKVYRFKPCSNSIFSIGLMTCPYPYFRIPGTAAYSIAYESTGKLRINNAFAADTLLPKLVEGDVVGFGYRYSSGTIFITHNGKKMMDVTHKVGITLFVGLGAMNAAYTRTYTKDGLFEDPDNVSFRQKWSQYQASTDETADVGQLLNRQLLEVHDPKTSPVSSDPIDLHLNLGQLGFVFIEANVKKYAFGSVFGDIGIPPAYNGDDIKQDMLLQKGDELPPGYPDNEVDFFGNIQSPVSGSLMPSQSPSQLTSGPISETRAHSPPVATTAVISAIDQEHDEGENGDEQPLLINSQPQPKGSGKNGFKKPKKKKRKGKNKAKAGRR